MFNLNGVLNLKKLFCQTQIEWSVSRLLKISCGVRVTSLPDGLMLFRLLSEIEAKRVLKDGKKRWGEAILYINHWCFRVGCSGLWKKCKKRRIHILGLPLHLWCRKLFEAIGDLCGGFRDVEAYEWCDTNKVVVVADGGQIPEFVIVEDDWVAFKIALMEEIAPSLVVKPESLIERDKSLLISEEEWIRGNCGRRGSSTAKNSYVGSKAGPAALGPIGDGKKINSK
ncbi:uncharacterized protein LOC132294570 [Cornus florida]|uniref:uncharacterized protein LOC132294570 n=1 Tax=Cornus florida TaxID=4283 RepID=UPI0028990972|nr:uncharacterized protein LOC132294570 [Cornus florida]